MKFGNGLKNGNSNKPGFSIIDKFGENNNIDTGSTPVDIWSPGGKFIFNDNAIGMHIISDSADDNVSGLGARSIEIIGYSNDNILILETVNMNGLTPVVLNWNYKIITRMKVIDSGSSNFNIGNINVFDSSTGTILQQRIPTEEGQTLSAIQIIEKNKIGRIKSHYASYSRVGGNNSAQMRLKIKKSNGTIQTKYNIAISVNHSKDVQDYGDNGGIEVEEGDFVYWECIEVSANSTSMEAGFQIEIWEKLNE